MKRVFVILFSLVIIIGCISYPVAAYSKKTSMTTRYYNSFLADKANVRFKTQTRNAETIDFHIGLKGCDNKIRGDYPQHAIVAGYSCITCSSHWVDHEWKNKVYFRLY